jgi:hypothetical protein
MKIQIPDTLKADLPQGVLGKALSATPVVMTVVATMLAGLASSEMTRAQYDRSLAAQQQSKAGDQWSYFQAKRLRAAIQRSTADLLSVTAELHAIDPAAWLKAVTQSAGDAATPAIRDAAGNLAKLLGSAEGKAALDLLVRGEIPAPPQAVAPDATIKEAQEAIDTGKPDAEVAAKVQRIDSAVLEAALRSARERVNAFDTVIGPTNRTLDQFDAAFHRQLTAARGTPVEAAVVAMRRDFTSARLGYATLRYDAESRLNQSVAALYEVQVRKSNLSAERHHARSQRFFYGMLAAQLAVIVSTFAMVARQRNLLWSIAAAAGLGAVLFAAYVYLQT